MLGAERFFSTTLFMLSGLLIWAAHFGVLYVFAALACARRFADMTVFGIGIIPFFTIITTVPAAVGVAAILRYAIRSGRYTAGGENNAFPRFMNLTTIVIAILSLAGIFWNATPAMLVTPCK
jgi:hypothetical protein